MKAIAALVFGLLQSIVLSVFCVHMIYIAVRGLPVPAFYSSAWFRVYEMYLLSHGLAASMSTQAERQAKLDR